MNFSVEEFFARVRLEEDAPLWTPLFALGLFVLYLIVRILALGIVTMLINVDAARTGQLDALTAIVAAIVASLVMLTIIWWMLRARVSGDFTMAEALHLDVRRGSILLLVLFALGAAIGIDLVQLLFERFSVPLYLQGLQWNNDVLVWMASGTQTIVIGPILEGILLFGVVYPALAVGRDNLLAVVLTAGLFMLMRVFDAPTNAVLWLESFLTGFVLASIRAYTKSTRSAIVAGMIFGAFTFYKTIRLFRPAI